MIEKPCKIFATNGLPNMLMTDNMTGFIRSKFKSFYSQPNNTCNICTLQSIMKQTSKKTSPDNESGIREIRIGGKLKWR